MDRYKNLYLTYKSIIDNYEKSLMVPVRVKRDKRLIHGIMNTMDKLVFLPDGEVIKIRH